ncbi:MAG: acyltransferase [Anaerolineae bacterium]|nr:acyltransferase [Anaerolineae bacterium]
MLTFVKRLQMVTISPTLSFYLDLTRWIAALAVVMGHFRSYMFINAGGVENNNILTRIFYFVTGFGHEAVIIFFVLSGFLVGGKALSNVNAGKFNLKTYSIKRFSRIYLVVFLALPLGAALDLIGMHYFNQAGMYNGTYSFQLGSPVFSAQMQLTPGVALGNLFMLQTVTVPPLGTNLPLWSLANEFWYYILFPLCLSILLWRSEIFNPVISSILIIVLILFLPNKIVLYFTLWLLGVVIAFIHRSLVKPRILSFGLFFASLLFARFGIFPGWFFSDLVVASTFALTINALVNAESRVVKNQRVNKLNQTLSGFSYSLYAIHYPIMVLMITAIEDLRGNAFSQQPSLSVYLLYVLLISVVYVIAFFFSRLTEANTVRFRNLLFRLTSGKSMTRQQQA